MKNKNLIFNLLLAIMLLTTITACDKDDNGGDARNIQSFQFMIKFESPIGTNVLDSLGIQHMNNSIVGYNLGDLSVNWKNKENNLNPKWSIPDLWWCKTTEEYGSLNPNFSYKGVGTVLCLMLTDINVSERGYPEPEEEYTITLKSKKIFGNDSPHTIKYYVHIGGCLYNAKKCEVDGKDYPIIGPNTNNYLQGQMHLENVLVVFKVNPSQQNNQ